MEEKIGIVTETEGFTGLKRILEEKIIKFHKEKMRNVELIVMSSFTWGKMCDQYPEIAKPEISKYGRIRVIKSEDIPFNDFLLS